jgi:hypothetical protein
MALSIWLLLIRTRTLALRVSGASAVHLCRLVSRLEQASPHFETCAERSKLWIAIRAGDPAILKESSCDSHLHRSRSSERSRSTSVGASLIYLTSSYTRDILRRVSSATPIAAATPSKPVMCFSEKVCSGLRKITVAWKELKCQEDLTNEAPDRLS